MSLFGIIGLAAGITLGVATVVALATRQARKPRVNPVDKRPHQRTSWVTRQEEAQ